MSSTKLNDLEAEVSNITNVEETIKPVEWESLENINAITTLERINLNELRDPAQRNAIITSKAAEYVPIFMKILANVHTDDCLKYVLSILTDILAETPEFIVLLEKHRSSDAKAADPVRVFLGLLNKTDKYIVAKAFLILAAFIDTPASNTTAEPASSSSSIDGNSSSSLTLIGGANAVEVLIDGINHQLQNGPANAAIAVHALMSVLRKSQYRSLVCKAGIIPLIAPMLKVSSGGRAAAATSTNVQLIYEVGFCIWLLSYCPDSLSFLKSENVIPRMHDILKNVAKEKAIRVCITTMKNLITKHSTANTTEFVGLMISIGLPKTLSQLLKRNFTDTDISEDVKLLSDTLEHNINELSSFDEYRQEVLSGHLEWTPVHTSEKFWKENMAKFEADNYYILRELIRLLDAPIAETPLTVAIACHDLGQFSRFHSRGKKLLTELNAKSRVVELMESEDDEVRKQSLLCVQKIMIQNWEFLQK